MQASSTASLVKFEGSFHQLTYTFTFVILLVDLHKLDCDQLGEMLHHPSITLLITV